MADVFYRTPGADALDLWSGDSHDLRDVHSTYEAMSRQEQDIAEARRRAATHADARRNKSRLRRLSSVNRSPYGSPGSRLLAPGDLAGATPRRRASRGSGAAARGAPSRPIGGSRCSRSSGSGAARSGGDARARRREEKARDEAEARSPRDRRHHGVGARARGGGRPAARRRSTTNDHALPSERSQRSRVRRHPRENHRLGRGAHRRRGGRRRAFQNAAKGERFADSAFSTAARARRGSASRGKPRENGRERPQPD